MNDFVRFTSVNFMALLIDVLNKEEFKSNTHDFGQPFFVQGNV